MKRRKKSTDNSEDNCEDDTEVVEEEGISADEFSSSENDSDSDNDLVIDEPIILPQYNASDPNLFIAKFIRDYKIPREGSDRLLSWARNPVTPIKKLEKSTYLLHKYEQEYYGLSLLVSWLYFFLYYYHHYILIIYSQCMMEKVVATLTTISTF